MSKRSSNSHFSSSNGSMSYDDKSLENLVTRAEQLCFQTPVQNKLCRKTDAKTLAKTDEMLKKTSNR